MDFVVKGKKILIAEDHTILREGLKALLLTSKDLEIVGEADDGRKAVELAERLFPDLILMDLYMPGCSGVPASCWAATRKVGAPPSAAPS